MIKNDTKLQYKKMKQNSRVRDTLVAVTTLDILERSNCIFKNLSRSCGPACNFNQQIGIENFWKIFSTLSEILLPLLWSILLEK